MVFATSIAAIHRVIQGGNGRGGIWGKQAAGETLGAAAADPLDQVYPTVLEVARVTRCQEVPADSLARPNAQPVPQVLVIDELAEAVCHGVDVTDREQEAGLAVLENQREVARGGDLRLVVSKVEVADAVSSEVVDRVRRLPRGARVAIVFYSDAETHEKSVVRAEWETTSQRWTDEQTPAVFLVPLPGSPSALTDVLAEINGKRRLPALSVSDRVRFREVGAAALQGDSPLR